MRCLDALGASGVCVLVPKVPEVSLMPLVPEMPLVPLVRKVPLVPEVPWCSNVLRACGVRS